MLGWFHKMLPREERFFEMFEKHSRAVEGGAEALRAMLNGGNSIAQNFQIVMDREHDADDLTRDVLMAVRRTFITPFDRGDIKDLVHSMDDAIDMMHKTVKTVRLFEQTSFDPLMQQMGDIIVDAAKLTAEAVPLLEKAGANANRLSILAEQITRLEEQSDKLHEQGLKDLFLRHGRDNAMAYIVGSELYGELEKVVDRLEDVADEISGIVIEHV